MFKMRPPVEKSLIWNKVRVTGRRRRRRSENGECLDSCTSIQSCEFFNSSIQLQWNMVGMEKRQLIVVRMHNT